MFDIISLPSPCLPLPFSSRDQSKWGVLKQILHMMNLSSHRKTNMSRLRVISLCMHMKLAMTTQASPSMGTQPQITPKISSNNHHLLLSSSSSHRKLTTDMGGNQPSPHSSHTKAHKPVRCTQMGHVSLTIPTTRTTSKPNSARAIPTTRTTSKPNSACAVPTISKTNSARAVPTTRTT